MKGIMIKSNTKVAHHKLYLSSHEKNAVVMLLTLYKHTNMETLHSALKRFILAIAYAGDNAMKF